MNSKRAVEFSPLSYLCVLFLFTFVSKFIYAEEADSLTLARRFLNRFPHIRIDFNPSMGNGHTVAGFDVLEGLEHLDYGGKIWGKDFVGDSFLKTFAPERFVADAGSTFEFLNAKTEKALSKDPRLKLRLLGAGLDSDTSCLPVICMQPPFWPNSRFVQIDMRSLRHDLSHLQTCAMYVRQQSIPEVTEYAKKYRPDLTFNIEHLLSHSHSMAWMPVYGVGFRGTEKLARLLVSLQLIRSKLKKRGFEGAPVVVLESKLNDGEMAAVLTSVANFARELQQKVDVKVLDGTSKGFAREQSKAAETSVILLKFGTIPQRIFRGLMQWAPLPSVVAGTGALNEARYLGRPYLTTVAYSHALQDNMGSHREFMNFRDPYGLNDGIQIAGLQSSQLAFQALSEERPETAAHLWPIAGFILDSTDRHSHLLQSFRRASEVYRTKDQMIEAFAEAERNFGGILDFQMENIRLKMESPRWKRILQAVLNAASPSEARSCSNAVRELAPK